MFCHRSAVEKVTARQPAGYQGVLRASLHECAITALAIASGPGLVALGDASGDVSVLDISQVAWFAPIAGYLAETSAVLYTAKAGLPQCAMALRTPSRSDGVAAGFSKLIE